MTTNIVSQKVGNFVKNNASICSNARNGGFTTGSLLKWTNCNCSLFIIEVARSLYRINCIKKYTSFLNRHYQFKGKLHRTRRNAKINLLIYDTVYNAATVAYVTCNHVRLPLEKKFCLLRVTSASFEETALVD